MATLQRIIGAKNVFGEPVTQGDVTVLPVAWVVGGGGAGGGEAASPPGDQSSAEEPPGSGGGLGFGIIARPVGAYEIRDGEVRWRPAIDVTQLLLGLLLAGVLVARWLLRER